MIDAVGTALVCGFINIVCIQRQLHHHRPADNAPLCGFVHNNAEWCKPKFPPIYPTLKKDRT